MTTQVEYERQLSWRVKQVQIGKATPAYSRFSTDFPKQKRSRDQPSTPDPYDARMSKRQYEGRVKAWKRTLYELYPNLSDPKNSSPDGKGPHCNLFMTAEEARSFSTRVGRAYVVIVDTDIPYIVGRTMGIDTDEDIQWMC